MPLKSREVSSSLSGSIKKILIANRGEIAVRITRTCRALGIKTVAVVSSSDENSLHSQIADEAVKLTGAAYLDGAQIIEAAKSTGADAIHPGYGFLSERAEFSEQCEKAGLIFVGPPAEAMRKLGDKISAKTLAEEADVPIVPGFFKPGANLFELERAALEIGLPVMLKASAGGGGRGMRAVRSADMLRESLEAASSEALNAFGDGSMMVEKLIESPRHIEVQVVADSHGQVACLFERECSIQRRHQKLIEEAPSPLVDFQPELWDGLKGAAERIIRAARYRNAGTVEFIVDPTTGHYYFLEVNARLQVEHPVTEEICGIDLVRLQLEVAQGQKLPMLSLRRSDIRGHAIEARVIAEDPAAGFLPSAGPLLGWAIPSGPGIRVDTGFGKGGRISPDYDSLIAKVISFGADRGESIARLVCALEDFHVLGVSTNIEYLLAILRHQDFQEGRFDTGFISRQMEFWKRSSAPAEIGLLAERATSDAVQPNIGPAVQGTSWTVMDAFRN